MKQDVVRDRQAMLAGMRPVRKAGTYIFCTTDDATLAAALVHRSLAVFREEEGVSLVLPEEDARRHGFDLSMPMCWIMLKVFSALDGVGLTAGVAAALAEHGIPCNMIAAYHHDNVFVPEAMGDRALAILEQAQRETASMTA